MTLPNLSFQTKRELASRLEAEIEKNKQLLSALKQIAEYEPKYKLDAFSMKAIAQQACKIGNIK